MKLSENIFRNSYKYDPLEFYKEKSLDIRVFLLNEVVKAHNQKGVTTTKGVRGSSVGKLACLAVLADTFPRELVAKLRSHQIRLTFQL